MLREIAKQWNNLFTAGTILEFPQNIMHVFSQVLILNVTVTRKCFGDLVLVISSLYFRFNGKSVIIIIIVAILLMKLENKIVPFCETYHMKSRKLVNSQTWHELLLFLLYHIKWNQQTFVTRMLNRHVALQPIWKIESSLFYSWVPMSHV